MSTEPEVPPQRLWLPLQAALLLRGDEHDPNDIEYVPQNALAEVWEKAIAIARKAADDHRQLALEKGPSSLLIANAGLATGAWKVMHALEAARDAALSMGE